MEIQERSNPPAHSSNAGGGGSGSLQDKSKQQPGSGDRSSKDRSSGPGGAGKGSGGNKPEGGQGNGSGGVETAPGAVETGATSGEGGSSPLIPILIAIAVLAAISIGAVLARQRRPSDGEPGVPASPKAG